MIKQPEEGEIWEWRAFGRLSKALADRFHSYPIRLALINIGGEDLYLISPNSDHNVKLRKYDDRWILKFKLRLRGAPGDAELYNESAAFSYSFPVGPDQLTSAAALLRVKLGREPASDLSPDEFTRELEKASPSVKSAHVKKKRSQFEFEGGWLELADVQFAKHHTQSISIHSTDKRTVELMRERLAPGTGWEVMNYVEACRRWA
ncbi:MAG: hypothetical protein WAU45_15365 [Blastocatellia bacterium]